MFIYTNCKNNIEFNIKTKNGRTEIEANPGPFSYKATELHLPMQFFCVPSRSLKQQSEKMENMKKFDLENDKKKLQSKIVNECIDSAIRIRTSELTAAKVFCIETAYEKEVTGEKEEMTFMNLINDFGDKISKERLKKRKMMGSRPVNTTQFKLPNLLLPDFDKNTENVEELYKMDYLFTDEALKKMKKMDLEIDDLCPYIEKNRYSATKKEIYVAINGIYKILNMKQIKPEKIDKDFQFFLEDIKKDVVKGKLSPVGKDRLIVKLYILLLKANDYVMLLEQFPKFSSARTKLFTMLKCIGCTFAGDGTVKLTKKPIESFNLK